MTNWKAQLAAKTLAANRNTLRRTAKPQQKPHLIKPLGNGVHEPKTLKGMHWNPELFRWEGNESALAPFDIPLPATPGSPKRNPFTATGSAKPALIANVGATKNIQVVGGMVFDPQRMCWLKMAPSHPRNRSDSGGGMSITTDDDEDVFAGLDDLEDERKSVYRGGNHKDAGGSDDEMAIPEEFDIGPEMVRRQRKYEGRWRAKLDGWEPRRGEELERWVYERRWKIYDMVRQGVAGDPSLMAQAQVQAQ
jgi:hypothetical protein